MKKDFSLKAFVVGILAAFVGFSSSFAIVVQGLHGVGANATEAASGLMAASLLSALSPETDREVAITSLIAASGVTFFGIGGVFWGLLGGRAGEIMYNSPTKCTAAIQSMEKSSNRLYVGDCVAFMQKMSDNMVDLTVTSPPYDDLRNYQGYEFKFEAIAAELYRITSPAASSCGWSVIESTADGRLPVSARAFTSRTSALACTM